MKITHLVSATEVVELNSVRILADPWLVDGEYYGSWCHYPPYDDNICDLNAVDFIYVSHIHPDHCSARTLDKISRDIPVLIHRYEAPFLKRKIQSLGFLVTELPNDERTHLKDGVFINIIAADNCNPKVCGKSFGCSFNPLLSGGSKQIDSLCVIDNGDEVLVNVNDCPFPIAYEALKRVVSQYQNVDFLLLGYGSASLYPHCMMDYDKAAMEKAMSVVRLRDLDRALKTITVLKPRYYMPFAGTYVLGGSLFALNENLPLPELQEAVEWLESQEDIKLSKAKSVLLNMGESFDLGSESQTATYVPIDKAKRKEYIRSNLAKIAYDYEGDPRPELEDFAAILPAAFDRFVRKRAEQDVSVQTKVHIRLTETEMVTLDCESAEYKIGICDKDLLVPPYIYFEMDPKLFLRVLKGPRFAHWNNVEIGAHVRVARDPDIYEQEIHFMLCHFHA